MPCIALVAIKTGIFGPYETLIVMLYGTCPGGGISNFFTYYLRLNIDLSGKFELSMVKDDHFLKPN